MTYPSKLLLFGEYTIIHNSSALAIPFPAYKSHWSDELLVENEGFENTMDEAFSRESLLKIFEDLKKLKQPKILLSKMQQDLNNGLWFCSNSPLGYGLGSSGAVCAAIYERYAAQKSNDLEQLKKELARLEQSFHGKSSGIDPLISYIQSPLWVHKDGRIEKANLNQNLEGKATIFTLDTRQPRVSAPLINFYMEQCEQADFFKSFVQPVSDAVESAIQALIAGDGDALMSATGMISALQFMYLPPMVTEELRGLWMQGIETQDFYLKVCGAGGGGLVLGVAKDWEKAKWYFGEYEVRCLGFS